jgi:DNA-directed RNA polymerase subunit K/omega
MKKLFNLLKESQHMDYRRLNIGEEDLDDTKMTNEEKRAFVEAVASYRKIGEAIYHNGNLMEAYQNIKKIVETAHKLTLQETGDWFDKVTVSRHMKSMNESFKIFTNTIKEVSTLQQRLESSYDEIGEILGKYYEIKEGNEFGAERARAIAAGEDTFQVGDKTFKVTDVDSEDKENAKDFVGENMKLSRLITKKLVNEGKYDADLDKIEAAVKNASSFMNIGAELKKAGIKYDFSTEMIAMYSIKVPGNTIAIVNKKYAAGAEREVGNYAIGLMEGKNLVKEIAIRKGTRIRSYIDGRTYTVDYEVVDTKHFSLRYGGGTTNLLKVINSNHPKIKVGSTEEFSTGDLKKSISAGIKTIIKESYIGEAKTPKFGDTVHLKSQNKTGMVYSVKGNEIVIRTVSGLVKGKLSDAEIVMDEGNEFGAERARAIAAGEDTFTVDGKTYKVTDVDPQDKENAKDFVGEMKLSNLILKKKVNEANVKLSDLLKSVVDGSTSRVGSTKVDKKTAEKLLKLYKVGDVAMQNKFDKMTADKVISAFKPFMENKKVTNEVAPEGWEKTVKAMKDEPGIDNPWALAWWMKGKGYQSHKK